ncbi:MAG: hypothetical protein GX250_01370 [Clostridiales bacterium]|nr:hypothetical protein [Clostridiales bacterium]
MYNRYACRCDNYCRTDLKHGAHRSGSGHDPPRKGPQSILGKQNPLSSLMGLIPKGIDIGDILLFAILLLMYLESGDEECLIILAVLLFTK